MYRQIFADNYFLLFSLLEEGGPFKQKNINKRKPVFYHFLRINRQPRLLVLKEQKVPVIFLEISRISPYFV